VHEALAFAIGFEKETVLFFVGMRGAVKDGTIIDEIVREEVSHVQMLAKYKQSLAAT